MHGELSQRMVSQHDFRATLCTDVRRVSAQHGTGLLKKGGTRGKPAGRRRGLTSSQSAASSPMQQQAVVEEVDEDVCVVCWDPDVSGMYTLCGCVCTCVCVCACVCVCMHDMHVIKS